jgi:RecJ-like exonuclease
MSTDSLKLLKNIVASLELAKYMCDRLTHVRHVHENDKNTFDRIIEQAKKTICQNCRGHGRNTIDNECSYCLGTGEKAYNPHEKQQND